MLLYSTRLYMSITIYRCSELSTYVLIIWLMQLVNGFECYFLISCVRIPRTYIIEINKYVRISKATET